MSSFPFQQADNRPLPAQVTFERRRLNFNGHYRAVPLLPHRLVCSDTLSGILRERLGYDRRTTDRIVGTLQDTVVRLLAEGSAVDLFGLVSVGPRAALRRPVAGTAAEVESALRSLSCADVRLTLQSAPTAALQREVKRRRRLTGDGV